MEQLLETTGHRHFGHFIYGKFGNYLLVTTLRQATFHVMPTDLTVMPTVFRVPRKFDDSSGSCPFPRNF